MIDEETFFLLLFASMIGTTILLMGIDRLFKWLDRRWP